MRRVVKPLLSAAIAVGLLVSAAACSSSEPPAATNNQSGVPTGTVAAANVAYCDAYKAWVKELVRAGANANPSDPGASGDGIKQGYTALIAIAPEAVKGDMTKANEAIGAIKAPAEVIFITGEPKDASNRVQEWVKNNCFYDPAKVT